MATAQVRDIASITRDQAEQFPNAYTTFRHQPTKLIADVRQDFWTVLAMVRERYGLGHYGLGIRNGDCRFTGATITHVHAHVLVGDPAATPTFPSAGGSVRARARAEHEQRRSRIRPERMGGRSGRY
jgi:diadenosine tetraphosphate (Ap4A) HIT family hydrolase